MAQTVVVTAGTTAASSSTIAIPAGSIYTFVIYATTGGVLADMGAGIVYKSPGGDVGLADLNISSPIKQVQGPAQVVINKYASATSCGVLQEA